MSELNEKQTPAVTDLELGQATRRGPLRAGDRVQLTDQKGRMHTIVLKPGAMFNVNRGTIPHDEIIGQPNGVVLTSKEGREFQVLRPLLTDYVLSMPRGAAVIYPKDSAQIVSAADIFPGARVIEAGVGSGALSISLLNAIGPQGQLESMEIRPEFADIAKGNVDLWFGQRHPAWKVSIGDAAELMLQRPQHSVDRVVLDMLAPWECAQAAYHVLEPGGVLLCYVATVTQMSRLVEELRRMNCFTKAHAWETTQRDWHLEGLAVRPQHSMIGHTGFLVQVRTLAPGVTPMRRSLRPQAATESTQGSQWDDQENWDEETVGARPISAKKVRKVRRDLEKKVASQLGEGRTAEEEPTAVAASAELVEVARQETSGASESAVEPVVVAENDTAVEAAADAAVDAAIDTVVDAVVGATVAETAAAAATPAIAAEQPASSPQPAVSTQQDALFLFTEGTDA